MINEKAMRFLVLFIFFLVMIQILVVSIVLYMRAGKRSPERLFTRNQSTIYPWSA